VVGQFDFDLPCGEHPMNLRKQRAASPFDGLRANGFSAALVLFPFGLSSSKPL